MKQAIRNEWIKLIKQRKSKVLFVLTLLAALLIGIGNHYFSSVTGFTVIDADAMPLSTIGLLGSLLLPLVAFIMAVDSISTEVTSGTIKYGFMAPISRNQMFFSKVGALAIFNGFLLASIFVIGFLLNVFTMSDNILMNFLAGLVAYVVTLLPMTLISLWGLLIGMHFSSGLSLGIGVIGLLALNIGQLFLPVLGAVSPLGYMDLYSSVVYGNTSLAAISSMLLYLVSYYIMLIALNLLRINQKEI